MNISVEYGQGFEPYASQSIADALYFLRVLEEAAREIEAVQAVLEAEEATKH